MPHNFSGAKTWYSNVIEQAVTFHGAAQEVCLANPQNREIWSQEGKEDDLGKMKAIKCFFRDEIVIFRGQSISWYQVHFPTLSLSGLNTEKTPHQINKMVESNWHMPMKFRCLNTGQKIKNSSEWKKVACSSVLYWCNSNQPN